MTHESAASLDSPVHMKHPIRGLLMGALAAPLGYWIGTMALAWTASLRISGAQAVRELAVIVSFGTPVACAAASSGARRHSISSTGWDGFELPRSCAPLRLVAQSLLYGSNTYSRAR